MPLYTPWTWFVLTWDFFLIYKIMMSKDLSLIIIIFVWHKHNISIKYNIEHNKTAYESNNLHLYFSMVYYINIYNIL